MEIDASKGDEKFRSQVRCWIGENAPEGLARLTDWSQLALNWWSCREEMLSTEFQTWEERMLAERLICAHWPARYGGRDLSITQTRVVDEECLRANVPRVFRALGEASVGDTILAHGTSDQMDRFLPAIVNGSDIYSQGFSEPNHGSDLGALETRAVVNGDELVITGQKTWTTAAGEATKLFVLCRTDRTVPNHRGLSYVIVDIQASKGRLEFRPIRRLTGDSQFYESFFDEVRVPLSNVIGGINDGWRVAMTTLEAERSGRGAASRNAIFVKYFNDLLDLVRGTEEMRNPEVRRKLVRSYAQLQALTWWSTPDTGGVHESIEKVVSANWRQELGELALEILGENITVRPISLDPKEEGGYSLNRWQHWYLSMLAASFGGGTNEIQRNVIAERVLKLPREPR